MARKPRAERAPKPASGSAKKREPKVSNLNPDDVIACFSEISSIEIDVARLNQRKAATFARFEKLGVDRKSIKRSITESKKDPAEVAAQLRRDTEYMVILEITSFGLDGQGDFSAGLTTPPVKKPSDEAAATLAKSKISQDGYNSGLAGGAKESCRFHAGSEAHVWWLAAWSHGHADRLAKDPNADKVKEASTNRKRRDPPIVEADVKNAEAQLGLVH